MNVRMRIARLHNIVEHRPAAELRQLLEVSHVVNRIGADQGHLHEAFVATAEHSRQRQAGLVGHQVGNHRRAVEVALHACGAVWIEPLRRPSARTCVHRFVEQPANFARLLFGGRPRLTQLRGPSPTSAAARPGRTAKCSPPSDGERCCREIRGRWSNPTAYRPSSTHTESLRPASS